MKHTREKLLIFNSIFNVCYQLLNVVFPLVTSAYVSRILLPEGMGKVALAQNWAQYFVIFAALGIPNYGIREVARSKVNQRCLEKTFSELWILNSISTTVSILLYILTIFFSGKLYNNFPLYLVVALNIVFNYLNIDWFYQGLEEYRYITVRSFAVKCISLICIFMLVHNANDYSWYAFISALAIGGNNILNWIHLPALKVSLVVKGIHPVKHLKSVLVLFSTVASIQLYTLLITTLLGALSTETAVGYYSNSMKIVRMLITVIAAIGGVLLPRLSIYQMQGEKNKSCLVVNRVFEILLFLFLPVLAGLLIVARPLILVLFGVSYLPAIPTMRISAFLILALGFSNLFGTQVLVTYKKEMKLLMCTLLGAFVCVISCFILIPQYHENGAAVASVISEFAVTVSTFVCARSILPIAPRCEVLLKCIAGTLIMSILAWVSMYFVHNVFLQLLIPTTVGMLAYLGFGLLSKNSILLDIVSLFHRR